MNYREEMNVILDKVYKAGYNAGYNAGLEDGKEQKEPTFKVGDEVIDSNGMLEKRSVVVRVSGSVITIMEGDGTVSRWEKEDFKKTGRHFPEIADVLKQIQEG